MKPVKISIRARLMIAFILLIMYWFLTIWNLYDAAVFIYDKLFKENYGDMVTVLICKCIVMFTLGCDAASEFYKYYKEHRNIDENKEALQYALQEAEEKA